MFFDLQINGFNGKTLGKDFNCNFWYLPEDEKQAFEQISKLNKFLFEQKTHAYLATLITNSAQQVEDSLTKIFNYKNKQDSNFSQAIEKGQAHIAGVHIEGGFISKLGVHPCQFAKALDFKVADSLIKKFPGLIKLWTLCPKIDAQGDLSKCLQDHGVKVSYGHSEADFDTAISAFEKYQVDLVTHWGNAMFVAEAFKQRDCRQEDLDLIQDFSSFNGKKGLGLAALALEKVNIMAIAGSKEDSDLHLDPRLLKALFERKKDKFILVSDLVSYTDTLPPEHLVGGLQTLSKHKDNATRAGLAPAVLKSATWQKPLELLKISI